MDVDWYYYLLIAPHRGSSPFEDQSDGVSLSVPTLINPQWTSIKLTVHSVHLLLLKVFRPGLLKCFPTCRVNCSAVFPCCLVRIITAADIIWNEGWCSSVKEAAFRFLHPAAWQQQRKAESPKTEDAGTRRNLHLMDGNWHFLLEMNEMTNSSSAYQVDYFKWMDCSSHLWCYGWRIFSA